MRFKSNLKFWKTTFIILFSFGMFWGETKYNNFNHLMFKRSDDWVINKKLYSLI